MENTAAHWRVSLATTVYFKTGKGKYDCSFTFWIDRRLLGMNSLRKQTNTLHRYSEWEKRKKKTICDPTMLNARQQTPPQFTSGASLRIKCTWIIARKELKSSLIFSFVSDEHLRFNIVINLLVKIQLYAIVGCSWNCIRLLAYCGIKLNSYLRFIWNNSITLWISTVSILLVFFLAEALISHISSQRLYMSIGVCRFMCSPERRQLASSMEAGDRWGVSRGSCLIDVFWG